MYFSVDSEALNNLQSSMTSINKRLSRDEAFLSMTEVLSLRSTCIRRHVSCILTNAKGHVLATGYNGPPSGWPHCIDEPCPGAESATGTDLDLCEAIHAEQNALLQCNDTQTVYTAYCNFSPCVHCVKLLLNTSCQRIVFRDEYSHSEAKELWQKDPRKREWIHLPQNEIQNVLVVSYMRQHNMCACWATGIRQLIS